MNIDHRYMEPGDWNSEEVVPPHLIKLRDIMGTVLSLWKGRSCYHVEYLMAQLNPY
jgi:hypothetical protein